VADGVVRFVSNTVSISEADDNGFAGAYRPDIVVYISMMSVLLEEIGLGIFPISR
jgi:hypothetical protein